MMEASPFFLQYFTIIILYPAYSLRVTVATYYLITFHLTHSCTIIYNNTLKFPNVPTRLSISYNHTPYFSFISVHNIDVFVSVLLDLRL